MATKSLNKYEIVQAIINKFMKYQNSMYADEIVQSIGKICYHLLTSRKSDLHEYK